MIKRFYELQEKVASYYPEADMELLKKAYTVATAAHLNQKRATNEPYIIHPLAVAGILADMKLDEISIAAGLLHDVIEDSQEFDRKRIEELFGTEIADIVWGVTKITKISRLDVEEAHAETLKKMIITMTSNIRVILIKLADRLHNVRTLSHLSPEKQKKIARETLEIYSPIAYRLGMGKIKEELEDISFMYLHPEEFREIQAEMNIRQDWAMAQLEKTKKEIAQIMDEMSIQGEIHYRVKRVFSIYKKIVKQNISVKNVYDLLALRIITDTVASCYTLMGMIHQKWPHIPIRWRDFITSPKSNFYQSIHTTIFNREGINFEIQIRTREMHKNAEEGIAAHWKYKEGLHFLESDDRLQWFKEMIEYHKHNPDPREFLNLVKKELNPNEIFVFTPKGRVVNLKLGATPIDFAYAIHSEIGNHCKGALVNEKMVPLRTPLNSGDVVEIITQKNIAPSADWLKYVVTTRAKRAVSSYLQKQENLDRIEKGKKAWNRFLRECRRRKQLPGTDEDIQGRLRELGYPEMESFFRDLGSGRKTLAGPFLKALFPELDVKSIKPAVSRPPKRSSGIHKLVRVDELQDIDISFARCCHPIKGEKVVGYLTRNRGLVVHAQGCVSIAHALPSRLIKVNWNELDGHTFQVRLELLVQDRPGILTAVTAVPAGFDSNIKKIEQEQATTSTALIRLVLEVREYGQYQDIVRQLNSLSGILQVSRKR